MRIWIVAGLFALVACKKEASKPNLSKMEPEEACRVIGKRAFECKGTIVPRITDQLTKAGASASMIDKVTTKLGSPAMCEGVTKEALDQIITCYDPDCGKLASCYEAMMASDLRPAGPTDHQPDPAPAVGSAVAPAPAPVAAAAETFKLGNVMPDSWFEADAGCAKTITRITGCAKDKAFTEAITAGMAAEEAKEQVERAGGMAGWADANNSCEQLVSTSYPDEGFLGARWDNLVGDELADCAKLGAAIREAGGLPGGAMDD